MPGLGPSESRPPMIRSTSLLPDIRIRDPEICCLSFAGLVVIAGSLNPIPSRTRPLNFPAPMVLSLKTWESRSLPGLRRTDTPLDTMISAHQKPHDRRRELRLRRRFAVRRIAPASGVSSGGRRGREIANPAWSPRPCRAGVLSHRHSPTAPRACAGRPSAAPQTGGRRAWRPPPHARPGVPRSAR